MTLTPHRAAVSRRRAEQRGVGQLVVGGLELRLVEEVEVDTEGEEGEVERGVLRDLAEEVGEELAVVGRVPLELLLEVAVERRRGGGAAGGPRGA